MHKGIASRRSKNILSTSSSSQNDRFVRTFSLIVRDNIILRVARLNFDWVYRDPVWRLEPMAPCFSTRLVCLVLGQQMLIVVVSELI